PPGLLDRARRDRRLRRPAGSEARRPVLRRQRLDGARAGRDVRGDARPEVPRSRRSGFPLRTERRGREARRRDLLAREPARREEARRIARAAEAKWVVPDTGAVADGGRFAHLLLDALLELGEESHDPHWAAVAGRALSFLHEKGRDPNGHYPNRWDRPVTEPL